MPKSSLFKGLIVFFIILTFVSGRVFYLQRNHFIKAENHYKKSNWKLAVREYTTSMHFYIPFSPYTEKAAQRLWQMGEMFEKKGQLQRANAAYSSLRSSLYASRSLFTPKKHWIDKCDEKIARLNTEILLKEGAIRPDEFEKEIEKHLYVLKTDRAPSPLWSMLSAVGFTGWVASIIFIIFKGFDRNLRVRKRPAVYGICCFVMSFILWVVALMNA
jgi:hypothetical protein